MTIARTILRIGVSVFSILLAMLTGAILILLIGKDPILAYGFLFRGAFGSLPSIGETIVKVTPLIFTGLAAVFSYQCGMLNLGIEGQFIAGAIAANWLSTIVLPFTGAANMILSLIGGMAAGAVWGAIPGLLKAFRNLNEMIIGILLNYVALLFMGYLYAGPLMEANIPQTAAIEPADRLSRILPPTRVHAGILIALAVLILIYYYLYNTASGFRLRVVGNNPVAALVNGLPVKRMTVISFVASGAISGLGGAVEVLGVSYRLMGGFDAGFGFDGVAIALIGQLNPIGTGFVAYLFAVLRVGANTMQVGAGIPSAIVDVVQAIIIIFAVGAAAFVSLPEFQQLTARIFRKKQGA